MGWQGDPQGIVQEVQIDHMNKLYMHNPEFVLENEMHKLLWDFEIQTDHVISARASDSKKKKAGNQPNS